MDERDSSYGENPVRKRLRLERTLGCVVLVGRVCVLCHSPDVPGRLMSTFTHLTHPVFFWLLSEPLSNTEDPPLWQLLYAFVLFISKLGKYGSKQHLLAEARAANNLEGDPAALMLPQPAVLTAGYFVLLKKIILTFFSLFLEEGL